VTPDFGDSRRYREPGPKLSFYPGNPAFFSLFFYFTARINNITLDKFTCFAVQLYL